MRETILTAAMLLAAKPGGFKALTRDGVAKRAGVAAGLVTYYFTNMEGVRNAVVRKAISDENLAVLGGAIGYRHALAMRAPDRLREKAIRAAF